MSKPRCPWLRLGNPIYTEYHDKEWGRPVKDDRKLFEMLILEGAQAGLSWETVLMKRSNYQKAFHGFNVKKVANMSAAELNGLLKNEGLIRNRLKIASTKTNAELFLQVQKEFGSFSNYLWGFNNHKVIYNRFKSIKDYPAKTELSDRISKDMKKRGFKFVGSTIIYAYLQGIGIVQDHSVDCYLHGKKFKP